MSDDLVKDLHAHANSLECSGWVEAPKAIRQAIAEIEKMRAERDALLALMEGPLHACTGGYIAARTRALRAQDGGL